MNSEGQWLFRDADSNGRPKIAVMRDEGMSVFSVDACGATLRDRFAMSVPMPDDVMPDDINGAARLLGISVDEYARDPLAHYVKCIAKVRYMLADAMIAERTKEAKE